MKKIFKKLISANLGDEKAKWEVISHYDEEIKRISRGNKDMETEIILRIYNLFNNLEEKYEKFFESVNK